MSRQPVFSTEHALRFPGTTAGLDGAVRALRGLLYARRVPPQHRHDVELVFEEIASNIVNYGRPAHDVEVGLRFDGDTILTFEDDGVAFDLREQPAPPVPASRGELRIGGLGLVIVRDICTRIDYERTSAQRNRLTLVVPARR